MHLKMFTILSIGVILFQTCVCTVDVSSFLRLSESDRNTLTFFNTHRASNLPALKLTIPIEIEQPIQAFEMNGSFSLKLNDSSSLTILPQLNSELNVTEYSLVWHGGAQNVNREVCVHYAFNNASWYSTYQKFDNSWPMSRNKSIPKTQFGFLHQQHQDSPGGFFAQPFYAILEYLFVGTDGFALVLDQHAPWFFRIDANHDDPKLCFSVNSTWPYMSTHKDSHYLDIKLHLFAGTNIRTVTDYVVHHSGLIPQPSTIPEEKMFKHPTWKLAPGPGSEDTQIEGPEFVANISKFGFGANDVKLYGFRVGATIPQVDLQYLSNNPNLVTPIIDDIHKRGFGFGTLLKDHFTYNANLSLKHFSTNVENWKLEIEKNPFRSKVDYFELTEFELNHNFDLKDTLMQQYPSLFTAKYVQAAAQIAGSSRLTTQMAFKNQNLTSFVRLYPTKQNLITNILSLSIGGYSFISGTLDLVHFPEEYIRVVQAMALIPNFSVGLAPWQVSKNESFLAINRKYFQLHAEYAPTFVKLSKRRICDGSPIVRPLWYVAPDDPQTYSISDQYMLGDDILVAPVLDGSHRQVYLPEGEWIDQHGLNYRGPQKVNIAVPLEELPIFKRKHPTESKSNC